MLKSGKVSQCFISCGVKSVHNIMRISYEVGIVS